MNSSTESPCSQVVSTLFIAITSTISFLAFTGNILVTVTFLKTQSLRTSTNYYIVNMAISDILCSCFGWLLYATDGMLTSGELIKEPSASILCKLGMYSRGVSQVVSVLSLVLITVDRYIAVVFPFKTTTLDQGKIRLILLLGTWLIPIAFFCPYILYAKVVKVDGQIFCRLLWNFKTAVAVFNVFGFVMFFCIPLITIIILFSGILKELKEQPIAQNDIRRSTIRNSRQRQHQKITKILISISAAFFVCWTPLCVYVALKMFQPDLFRKDKCQILVALFFYVLPSLNTAINPLILFWFSTNYRQALANLCPLINHAIHLSRNKRIVPLHVTSVQMKEVLAIR